MSTRRPQPGPGSRTLLTLVCTAALVMAQTARPAAQRAFDTPDAAARALIEAARHEHLDTLLEIFGAEGASLVDMSDPVTPRRNRAVFAAAASEGWQLVDGADGRKTLLVGREHWPFPVPLVRRDGRWTFDAATGKEEVLARRIGRNELGAIRVCHVYVAAQRLYAQSEHDRRPAGTYARQFRSDAGTHNGLYWPAGRGEKRSPLGDLLADAEIDQHAGSTVAPMPFLGYYFRILTSQGASAPGGAADYLREGRLSGGFALVAWPAQYGVTGVMTFIVSQDGVVSEQDLGPATSTAAAAMRAYDPDQSWARVEP